jgi:hypothetical protein
MMIKWKENLDFFFPFLLQHHARLRPTAHHQIADVCMCVYAKRASLFVVGVAWQPLTLIQPRAPLHSGNNIKQMKKIVGKQNTESY